MAVDSPKFAAVTHVFAYRKWFRLAL